MLEEDVKFSKNGMAYVKTNKNLCKFLYYDKAHDKRVKKIRVKKVKRVNK